MADLFKVIDGVFDKEVFATLTNKDLKGCAFNVQRLMSIQYPVQAANLNMMGINSADVVKSWHFQLENRFTRTPQWTKVGTAKERAAYQKTHKTVKMPERRLIVQYINHHGLDSGEFEYLKKINPEELVKEIKALDKAINSD